MHSKHSKLRQKQQEEQTTETQQTSTFATTQDFNSVEEMLRHDGQHTTVPPAVEQRLTESIRHEPRPAKPWWQRVFRRDAN